MTAPNLQRTYFVSVFLVATILLAVAVSFGPSDVSAQSRLAKGTWKGKMVGKGSYLKAYYIFSTANLTGTFSGDFSSGAWIGDYVAKYDNEAPESGNGVVMGNYTWRIDNSGALTGEVFVTVKGLFIGEWKIPIQGSAFGTGILKGTWNGIFLPTTLNHRNRTPVTTDLRFEVSGEFEGTLESPTVPATPQTPTATQPPPTAPSPTPTSPTLTPTPTPTKTVPPPQTINLQFFVYVAIAAVLLAGAYFLRIRQTRK